MDRGELVEVDVHEGLETTLIVLGHKLKHTSIEVVRDYDKTLPKLTVRGSELNQVWTNLLDNAIDALGESGTITIATRRDGDCARDRHHRRRPRHPAREPRPRVRLVLHHQGRRARAPASAWPPRGASSDRHDGTLSFDSEPGRTTFHVRLPLKQSA